MNLFGGFGCGGGCNSSCDVLTWIILISIISSCCNKGGPDCCEQKCGCGLDFCTILILLLVFGCCGFGKRC